MAAPAPRRMPAPPPCLATGGITFGSFNNPAKLSEATLDAWAKLLIRLQEARLLLKGKSFADASTRALYLDRLAQRGVAAARVELVAQLPESNAHLALYNRIDIALDPFPYNGTTTTCEALWMGVPVVALRGDRHAGRVVGKPAHCNRYGRISSPIRPRRTSTLQRSWPATPRACVSCAGRCGRAWRGRRCATPQASRARSSTVTAPFGDDGASNRATFSGRGKAGTDRAQAMRVAGYGDIDSPEFSKSLRDHDQILDDCEAQKAASPAYGSGR